MAKKSRRRARAQAPAQQTTPARTRPAAQPAPAPTARTTADIAEEYRYVISDLKRIGILAAGMFALLVIAALLSQFVIH